MMGRKQVNADTTIIRLPEGFLERIDASLEPKEPRAAFFREAVERELKRRERKADSDHHRRGR
jgi:metal-responsive CopG/Arc/MetJ family transcriptional regulator